MCKFVVNCDFYDKIVVNSQNKVPMTIGVDKTLLKKQGIMEMMKKNLLHPNGEI